METGDTMVMQVIRCGVANLRAYCVHKALFPGPVTHSSFFLFLACVVILPWFCSVVLQLVVNLRHTSRLVGSII